MRKKVGSSSQEVSFVSMHLFLISKPYLFNCLANSILFFPAIIWSCLASGNFVFMQVFTPVFMVSNCSIPSDQTLSLMLWNFFSRNMLEFLSLFNSFL